MASSTAWYFSLTMLRLILKVGVSMPFSTVNCSGMTWMACTCTREERGAGQQQVRAGEAGASCKQIQQPAPLLACPATPQAGSVMQRQMSLPPAQQKKLAGSATCSCPATTTCSKTRYLPFSCIPVSTGQARPSIASWPRSFAFLPYYPFPPFPPPYLLKAAQLRLPALLLHALHDGRLHRRVRNQLRQAA